MRTLELALVLLLSSLFLGCGALPAVTAIKDGRIALEVSESQVREAAGPPDLIIARRGVETYFYDAGKGGAVVVAFHGGKVIAFDDSAVWPSAAADATDEADDPVAKGTVRVGMTEAALREALGDPDGITAKDGLETLHWLTGDDVDSVVQVQDDKVIGFWDRPVNEFTQNLPTADRDEATTSGRVRVGMKMDDVKKLLGEPDGISGKKGLTIHRYETDPVFGDEIWYAVDYKDGVVHNLHEFNVTRDEEEKELAEAQRQAAQTQEEEAESSIFSIFSNPLVQAVIGTAIGAAANGGRVSHETVKSSAERTLELNGKTYTGGEHLGQPCSTSNGCPSGYACHIMAGDSGVCVE
jgi:hypothetical protein